MNGNAILDDINPQMGQIRYDVQRLNELAQVYTAASPDLFTARQRGDHPQTLNQQRGDLDAALLASIGSATPLGTSSSAPPRIWCGQATWCPARNCWTSTARVLLQPAQHRGGRPAALRSFGGNGYSLATMTELLGAPTRMSTRTTCRG